jgi:methylene-fatty-acyl-phospholipid synthase
MDIVFTAACAALLALERLTYWYVWTYPDAFAAWVRGRPVGLDRDPVRALRSLFVLFKIIQVAVLVGWCIRFGQSWVPVPQAPWGVFVLGVLVLAFGQVLNFSVMARLGNEGVFYGNRFGRPVAWQTGFPFSLLPHPQYLGAALSVWGFMLVMRFPQPDWAVLPSILTIYYVLGARLESRVPDSA